MGISIRQLAAAMILFTSLVFTTQCSHTREVKVISAVDGRPVGQAFVYIWSTSPFDETSNVFVTTDESGRALAQLAWDVDGIRVWKPGFALNGFAWRDGEEHLGESPLVVTLRPLTASEPLLSYSTPTGSIFGVGEGLCLATRRRVPADHPCADIAVIRDPVRPDTCALDAYGDGGIAVYRTEFDDSQDFHFFNTPEAPEHGYEKRVTLGPASGGLSDLYFVRTRDGRSYAKVRFNVVWGSTPTSLAGYNVTVAYQPDGTRNLEVAIDQEFLFPLDRFGIDKSALPARRVTNAAGEDFVGAASTGRSN